MTATNISQRFHLQDGGKINWHRYGTKITPLSPYVFPRVCQNSEFYRNSWTHRTGFFAADTFSYLQPIHLCHKNSATSKITALPSETLFQTRLFRHSTSTAAKRWKLSRSKTFDRRLWPVYQTERPPLCTARCAWGSASRGSICISWVSEWVRVFVYSA